MLRPQVDNGIRTIPCVFRRDDGTSRIRYGLAIFMCATQSGNDSLTSMIVQHLLSGPRLPFTAAYFSSIALTLYFSVGVSRLEPFLQYPDNLVRGTALIVYRCPSRIDPSSYPCFPYPAPQYCLPSCIVSRMRLKSIFFESIITKLTYPGLRPA